MKTRQLRDAMWGESWGRRLSLEVASLAQSLSVGSRLREAFSVACGFSPALDQWPTFDRSFDKVGRKLTLTSTRFCSQEDGYC